MLNQVKVVFSTATFDTVPFLGNLVFTVQGQSSETGVNVQASLDNGSETTSLPPPSLFQFSGILARLTHVPGLQPQLGSKIRQQQAGRLAEEMEKQGLTFR